MKASQSSRCDFEEDINERFMKEKKEKKIKRKQRTEDEDVTGLSFFPQEYRTAYNTQAIQEENTSPQILRSYRSSSSVSV